MLVLTRKTNQSVVIGGNIEVCVTRIDGDTVKLGIKAPRSISVFRKELIEDVAQTTQAAAIERDAAAGAALTDIKSRLQARSPNT